MEHVLVDKRVLFLDPDIINRIRGKNGLPFIAYSDLRAQANNGTTERPGKPPNSQQG
jgi:hypothetical protein